MTIKFNPIKVIIFTLLVLSVSAQSGCGAGSDSRSVAPTVTYQVLDNQMRVNSPGRVDVWASYRWAVSRGTLLPRAYHKARTLKSVGDPVTDQYIEQLRRLGIPIEVGDVETQVYADARKISLNSQDCLPALYHEVTHLGQIIGCHGGSLDREEGAMVVEVRALMAEGWTDQRIRDLSLNNSKVPQAVYDWIRQNGPELVNQPSDIGTCFQWGLLNRLPSNELSNP